MHNSRLLELLHTFKKKEISEVRKFLASPFFNQRTDVLALFEYLTKRKNPPTKEQAAAYFFPKEAYDPQRIRQLMSWLYKLLEQYLLVKDVQANPQQSRTRLALLLRNRGVERQVETALKEAETLLKESPHRSGHYFRQQYLLTEEKHLLAAKRKRTGEQHLQELIHHHDAFFLIETLRQACLIRSYQAVNKGEYDLGLLTSLLPHFTEADWQKWPAAAVYFYGFKMLDEPDGKPFFQLLKKQLELHRAVFPPVELREVYLFAINFSIRQLNSGDGAYRKEAFQLYRDALEAGLLTLDGHISRFSYRNIVALGLNEQEFEWVENFLMEYKGHLEEPYREATFSFNLAKLEYERKNFDSAILLLQKADYKDILLNLAAKTLLLKIYYLLDEQRLLDSHLSAMRRFVKRKKMVGYHRENYLNIISITQKLTELNPFDRQAKKELRQVVEVTEPLTERGWLLEQLGG